MNDLKEILKLYNIFYGYANVCQTGVEGLTDFFEYSDTEVDRD